MTMKGTLSIGSAAAILLSAAPALADWDPGDPYKMHFPQLPDPSGWDVRFTKPAVIADDWLCTETGDVSDVHFWFSYHQDQIEKLQGIHLSIHADDRTGPFSKPGEELWSRDFSPTEFVTRPYGTGEQGWLDPLTGEVSRPDHFQFFQANITDIKDPFVQKEGTIYWLDVSVAGETGAPIIGWKTSRDHFEDDAVFSVAGSTDWRELRDPATGESLDMAFVITPAPSSLALLGLGGLVATRRRR